jgi:hypothetical protein
VIAAQTRLPAGRNVAVHHKERGGIVNDGWGRGILSGAALALHGDRLAGSAVKCVAFVTLALLTIGIAAIAFLDPFAFAVLGISIFGTGHPSEPPPIAQGANFDFLHGWPTEPRWTKILQRKFPVDSSVTLLRATLQQQGFEIASNHNTARYEWGGMPCLKNLSVDWESATSGKVESVSGGYGSACL